MNFHLSKEYRYHTKNRKEKTTIDTLIQKKGKKSQKREYKVNCKPISSTNGASN